MPRRRLFHHLIAIALLGIVTNAVVAFVLACFARFTGPGDSLLIIVDHQGHSVIVLASRDSAPGCASVSVTSRTPSFTGTLTFDEIRGRFLGPSPTLYSHDPEALRREQRLWQDWTEWATALTATDSHRTAIAAGFPFLSFRGGVSRSTPARQGIIGLVRANPPRLIPVIPIPLGFAANSAIYAALWAMLWFGEPPVRRALRHRRGHCPRCNYDLRADLPSGCPECGWNRAASAKT